MCVYVRVPVVHIHCTYLCFSLFQEGAKLSHFLLPAGWPPEAAAAEEVQSQTCSSQVGRREGGLGQEGEMVGASRGREGGRQECFSVFVCGL